MCGEKGGAELRFPCLSSPGHGEQDWKSSPLCNSSLLFLTPTYQAGTPIQTWPSFLLCPPGGGNQLWSSLPPVTKAVYPPPGQVLLPRETIRDATSWRAGGKARCRWIDPLPPQQCPWPRCGTRPLSVGIPPQARAGRWRVLSSIWPLKVSVGIGFLCSVPSWIKSL